MNLTLYVILKFRSSELGHFLCNTRVLKVLIYFFLKNCVSVNNLEEILVQYQGFIYLKNFFKKNFDVVYMVYTQYWINESSSSYVIFHTVIKIYFVLMADEHFLSSDVLVAISARVSVFLTTWEHKRGIIRSASVVSVHFWCMPPV